MIYRYWLSINYSKKTSRGIGEVFYGKETYLPVGLLGVSDGVLGVLALSECLSEGVCVCVLSLASFLDLSFDGCGCCLSEEVLCSSNEKSVACLVALPAALVVVSACFATVPTGFLSIG